MGCRTPNFPDTEFPPGVPGTPPDPRARDQVWCPLSTEERAGPRAELGKAPSELARVGSCLLSHSRVGPRRTQSSHPSYPPWPHSGVPRRCLERKFSVGGTKHDLSFSLGGCPRIASVYLNGRYGESFPAINRAYLTWLITPARKFRMLLHTNPKPSVMRGRLGRHSSI
jgi:hypothetical protein